jgi:predicted transposase YdaD
VIVIFNPFDVATKELIWDDPAAWLEKLGVIARESVELIDSDITTLTAAADKVIKVGGSGPYIVNIELHSYHDKELVRTLWFRQVALDYRHRLPVLTILVLLCKEANSPNLTGSYERALPDGWQTNRYNYKVVRLWQEDPESYLTAGVELVPLAPLTAVTAADVPALIRRMADRINQEPQAHAVKLWIATSLLMGLRYDAKLTMKLLEGVHTMHQSSTYQWILDEGRLSEAHRFIRRLGTEKFGVPDPTAASDLEAIQDVDRLEALGVRILRPDIKSWDDLLKP